MKIVRILFLALASLVAARAQNNPYEGTIRGFEAADLRNPPAPNSIVFVGSSSIVNWSSLAADFPRYNVLNRGFGGSQSTDALFFFDRIVTRYRPPILVYYEGDNDIAAGRTVDQVLNDWTNLVARVKAELPNTHIVYISIKPSPSRQADLPEQRAVNERVRAMAGADPKIHFADVFTPMLTPEGNFRPELYVADQLHMTPAGYAIWRSVVGPISDEIAASYPISITKTESNALLIDFGAADMTTGVATNLSVAWNNITTIGSTSIGTLSNLVTTAGQHSAAVFRMVSRFNGANENGTVNSTLFPATATRDSLFGNTETFSGLANVTPIFRLTGLTAGTSYRFTFYASRTGVGDNRETRYTVTGGWTGTAELNAANNVDQTATINGMTPDDGAITVALSPGPNNNNANHFTYLGVMRVDAVSPAGPSFLFDFGAAGSPTDTQTGTPTIVWNNVTPEVGGTDAGALANLAATNGASTPMGLQMVSKFNGANTAGTTGASVYPATATQDSLFGNTELFNGLANVTPTFKLVNLDANATYGLTFYASRTGVADNRETRYTVAGLISSSVVLNASNNTNNVVTVEGMRPDAERAITISLAPGFNNNNANHFTYLGVLQVNWTTGGEPTPIVLSATSAGSGLVNLRVAGVPGMTYLLQSTTNFLTWEKSQFVPLSTESAVVTVPAAAPYQFFRAVQ